MLWRVGLIVLFGVGDIVVVVFGTVCRGRLDKSGGGIVGEEGGQKW